MQTMTFNELANDEHLMQQFLLAYVHHYNTTKNFSCINPAHADHTPSMSYNAKANQLHCFGCNCTLGVLDVFAYGEGIITDWGEGFPKYDKKAALDLLKKKEGITIGNKQGQGIDFDFPDPRPLTPPTDKKAKTTHTSKQPKTETEPEKDYSNEISYYQQQLELEGDALNYLAARGITKETAKRFGIGYNKASKMLVIPDDANAQSSLNKGYSLRSISPDAFTQKRREGTANPFNVAAIEEAFKTGQNLWVTEGAFDAMTVMLNSDRLAVALNSVDNVKIFTKIIATAAKKHKESKPKIYIMLDDDEAGRIGTSKLATQLLDIQYRTFFRVTPDYHGCKDINELYTSENGHKLTSELLSARTKQPESPLFSFIKYQQRMQDVKAISTGFKALDDVLNGGFRAGIIAVGAESSVGKTTLTLQIATNIAASGQHVLYSALEMDRNQLISKTLSRLTYQQPWLDEPDKVQQETAAMTANRLQYDLAYIVQHPRLAAMYNQVADYYSNNIDSAMKYIDSADGMMTVGMIEQLYQQYREQYPEKAAPVLVLDYLQILQDESDRLSDKQKMDKAVTKLKSVAVKYQAPIILISSFNRQSNGMVVADMTAFKESGIIEYSADVAIQLRPEITKELYTQAADQIAIKEEVKSKSDSKQSSRPASGDKATRQLEAAALAAWKAQEVRTVNVFVLKNRNGRTTSEPIQLLMFPKYNAFASITNKHEPATPLKDKKGTPAAVMQGMQALKQRKSKKATKTVAKSEAASVNGLPTFEELSNRKIKISSNDVVTDLETHEQWKINDRMQVIEKLPAQPQSNTNKGDAANE